MTSKRADFSRFLAILAIFQVFIFSIRFIAIIHLVSAYKIDPFLKEIERTTKLVY